MLAMPTYPRDYIAACRARVDANLRAYRKAVGKGATKEFEARFFNDQLLVLEYLFVHRLRMNEGKKANALNEVRVLCDSLVLNGGRYEPMRQKSWPASAGATIKRPPETMILPYELDEEIALNEADFVKLSKAFFSELEAHFTGAAPAR